MRKRCVLMSLVLAMLLVYSSALAEELSKDFVALDGLTWDTPVEEYADIFGTEPVDETDPELPGTQTGSFYDIEFPEYDAKGAVSYYCQNGSSIPFMITIDMEVNAPSGSLHGDTMQRIYKELVKSGDELYADRSEIVFSSAEEMEQAYKNRDKAEKAETIALLGAVSGLLSMYQAIYDVNDFSCISDAKGWLVDDKCGVIMTYSGQSLYDDMIFMCFLNIDYMINNDASLANPLGTPGLSSADDAPFALPFGIDWDIGKKAILEKLEGTCDYQDLGEVVYVYFPGTSDTLGYDAAGLFWFTDDVLTMFYYLVDDTDGSAYDDISTALGESFGEPMDDSMVKILADSLREMSPTIDAQSIWMYDGTILFCARDPGEECVYVIHSRF